MAETLPVSRAQWYSPAADTRNTLESRGSDRGHEAEHRVSEIAVPSRGRWRVGEDSGPDGRPRFTQRLGGHSNLSKRTLSEDRTRASLYAPKRPPLRGDEPRHDEREPDDGRGRHFLPEHEPARQRREHGNHVLDEAHLDGAKILEESEI